VPDYQLQLSKDYKTDGYARSTRADIQDAFMTMFDVSLFGFPGENAKFCTLRHLECYR
jgi:hypothetical protein